MTSTATNTLATSALASRRDAVLERLDDAAHGRGDHQEVVHQLRVGSRRADAALEFLLPWLPAKRTERLRARLKKLRQAAGRVRDCDVLRGLIRQAPRKHRQELKGRLKRRRKVSERRLAKVVAQLRRKKSLERLWNSVLNGEQLAAVEQESPQFSTWSVEQFDQWLTEFNLQATTALDSFEQLHAFRIAGKRLRYALELLPPAHATSIQLMPLLKELQTQLGVICDQESLRERLATWAGKASGKSAVQLTVDAQTAANCVETMLAAQRREWPSVKARLDSFLSKTLPAGSESGQNRDGCE